MEVEWKVEKLETGRGKWKCDLLISCHYPNKICVLLAFAPMHPRTLLLSTFLAVSHSQCFRICIISGKYLGQQTQAITTRHL